MKEQILKTVLKLKKSSHYFYSTTTQKKYNFIYFKMCLKTSNFILTAYFHQNLTTIEKRSFIVYLLMTCLNVSQSK